MVAAVGGGRGVPIVTLLSTTNARGVSRLYPPSTPVEEPVPGAGSGGYTASLVPGLLKTTGGTS